MSLTYSILLALRERATDLAKSGDSFLGLSLELLSQGGLCLSHSASRLGAESLLKASEKLRRVNVPENDVISVGDTNLGAVAAESDSWCRFWEHGSSSCRFTLGFLSCMN